MVAIIIDDESISIEEKPINREESEKRYKGLFEKLTKEMGIPAERVPEYLLRAFKYLRRPYIFYDQNQD